MFSLPTRCVFLLFLVLFLGDLFGQTFPGQGGLVVPPGAPAQTVGVTTSDCEVTGIGILGNGCTHIENVTINFQHTFVGDVGLFLIAPSGEVLELSSGNGGGGDNYIVTVFTDNTALFITAGAPPYNGTFRPEGRQQSLTLPYPNAAPLGTFTFANTFDGVNADGTWQLYINDFLAADIGVLNSWSITFTSGGGPAPEVSLGPDLTICPGESETLTATVTPGADSYLWSTGATTPSITVSPVINTQYIVTVTNNNCLGFDTINIVIDPNAVVANAGPDIAICEGESAILTATGGGPGATFMWSNGGTGPTITVTPAGSQMYVVTVTDGSCMGTDLVVVTVNNNPNANAGIDQEICEGESLNLSGSGGTANNHYLWSTGQTGPNPTVSPVETTTYTLTVTVNGCQDTDQVTITVNPNPEVDAGNDQEICAGESTELTATGSPGTYIWTGGIPGMSITVSPLNNTLYTVTVTENGCASTDQVFVEVINVNANAGPDETICEGESIQLTATGAGSIEWSTGQTTNTITVSPATTTTYSVTVTQGDCQDEADVTVEVNPVPVAEVSPDKIICEGESTLLVASGGNIYAWSNGQTGAQITVSPVTPTNYVVTVTANGCASTAAVFVDVNPSPDISTGPDQMICEGESATLQVNVTGSGSIIWSTGQTVDEITVSPGNTTTYGVTVTDVLGCSATDAVMVSVNPYPVANAGPDAEICEGDDVTLMATGGTSPNTYSWSTGQTGPSIQVSPSSDETYTVSVTIAGCESSDEVNVQVLPAAIADAGSDITVCEGNTQTDLVATGGSEYLWSTGQTSSTIQVVPNTTTEYSVTVTNSDGCTDVDDVSVIVTPAPPADAGPDEIICEGETVNLTATGGSSYLWSNSSGNASITVSPTLTTTYTVTVTSAAGCTDIDAVTVIVNSIPAADAGTNVFILPGDNTTLTATGGGTYLWSTGATDASITVMPDTTTAYQVTVTVNGCTAVDEVIVFVNEVPAVNLGPDVIICEGESVILDASIFGPFDIKYRWSTGDTTATIEVMPPVTTEYSITVSDNATGVSSIDTILVIVEHLPLGDVVILGETVFCQGSVVSYSALPVDHAELYTWMVPPGATILLGQGTTNIEVDWGVLTTGNVQLVVSNSCGQLPALLQEVLIETVPVTNGVIDGDLDPCDGSSAMYQLNSVSGADGFIWTLTGGGLITAGQGTDAVTINWNNTVGGELCAIASNLCGSAPPVCTTIATTTTPVAYAGPDVALCGTSTTLQANGTGTWSVVSGSGNTTFTDLTDSSALLTVDAPGTYTLSWTVENNGCIAFDQVDIEFYDSPAASAVSEDCNDFNTGYIVSFEISGGAAPYLVNGQPFIGASFTSVEIPAGSPYSFSITDANGCTASLVSGVAECNCASSAGMMDQNLIRACIDASITAIFLGGEMTDPNDILAYVLHDGTFPDGIIQWSDTPTFPFISGMTTGQTYFISVVVANDAGGGIPDVSDPCLAIADGTPIVFHDIPVANAGNDVEIGCSTNGILLSGESSTPALSYLWSVFDGGTISGSNTNIDITAATAGGYILTVMDPLAGCASADTVIVEQHELLLDGLQIVGNDPLCPGDCNGSFELFGPSSWLYSIDGVTFIPLSVWDNFCAGEYAVYVQDSLGCINDSIIQLNEPPTIAVGLGPDRTISAGEQIEIRANIEGIAVDIHWLPTDCAGCPGLFVQPKETTTYTIEVTDANGCVATDVITITVIPTLNIFVPSIFSPNGDNINDRLFIQANPSHVRIQSFDVFDRWGNLVYGVKDVSPGPTQNSWDGTFNGKPLGPGVYVYHLVALLSNNMTVQQKGDVTLIR